MLLLTGGVDASEIAKSPFDQREYAYLELPNRLKAVVVSDPHTDKAAAALNVNIGSASEPDEWLGLAHFLEHMLFLGTRKYPGVDEYKNYLDQHGGRDNAYTALENTVYFFDVNAAYLRPALDRFSQFFIAPLFNEEYVARERSVVHSEFMGGLQGGRQVYSAEQAAMNPAHPASRFMVGSETSLADKPGQPVRDALIAFYENHYSANLMTLVVVGREPLSTLEEWTRELFGAVPDHGANPRRMVVPMYRPDRLPLKLQVQPIQEERVLKLSFPIPPVEPHWRTKPTALIAHLLGHEGTGSLLELLKSRGWANGLSAGVGDDLENGASFEIAIALTRPGLDAVDAIIGQVFRAIELVGREGLQPWAYDELRRLAEMQFRFAEPAEPMSLAIGLSNNLHEVPATEVLRSGAVYDGFDEALTRRFLSFLRPDNLVLSIVAPEVQTDASTDRYAARYSLGEVDARALSRWAAVEADPSLAMPGRNPFIPESLAVLPADDATEVPERIASSPGYELWYKQDETFKRPLADFYFSVRSPAANQTAQRSVLTELYVDLVNDALGAFSYDASLGGLDYSLYAHMRGFSVRISGYSDKQKVLLERVLQTMTGLEIDPARFELMKRRMERGLRNDLKEKPYERAMAQVRTLLLDPGWSIADRLAALEHVDVQTLREFLPVLRGEIQLVTLAHGNLKADQARDMGGLVRDALLEGAKPVKMPEVRIVALQPGDHWLSRFATDHPESATVLYVQGAHRTPAAQARFAMMGQVLGSPFFDDLRTRQKLGYVVFATPFPLLETPGIAFVVQSGIADAEEIEQRIQSFIEERLEALSALDEATFERHRQALLGDILERETKLRERSNRYWMELDRRYYEFDRREQLAAAVRALSLPEFKRETRELLGAAHSRRLAIHALRDTERNAEQASSQDTAGGPMTLSNKRELLNARGYFPD
ncbi:MAG: insulinase family protein [Gammaproteobacteria bacterium]|nr:insulinase family protein [Gammaproteobacteria bacterium]